MHNPDAVAELERTARPALLLQPTALPVPLHHPARSYFGGLPKLPSHMSWPDSLFFAMQIDLSELPQIDGNPLPGAGTLYVFFAAECDTSSGDETRILYYEGSAHDLPDREPPSNLRPTAGGQGSWPWLSESELGARIGFRHPIRFIRATA